MKKFGICVESSHQKGLGHLIRALNLIELLKERGDNYLLIMNNDAASISFLKKLSVNFEVVEMNDSAGNWETTLVEKHKISIWINDRLDTLIEHARNVKLSGIPLVCIDDRGGGAELADINFGSLPLSFNRNLKGKKVLKGLQYLILDKKIDKYKKSRKRIERILVVLGGSDTYGVTLKVARILRNMGKSATIVTGPLFRHELELNKFMYSGFVVKKAVPSLVSEFANYDLAITGGGITPFEANASGLPCIVIANELSEMPTGQFLSKLGSSVFAGYHEKIKSNILTKDLNIEKMSILGMDQIKTSGVDNIYEEINLLWAKS
ncbi:MAG: glycosyl transferase [Candidatus Omnitrophota bacterium]|nr:glycosyl transferase [Candidatus Omnitrophota bacterium]